MVITRKKSRWLASPCQSQPHPHPHRRGNHKGETIGRGENCVTVFLSLFKLKRSANVTSMWIESPSRLFTNGLDGPVPPLDTAREKGTPRWHWQYQDTRVQGDQKSVGGFFPHTTKSNNQELDPVTGDIFYILVLCYVVPWWTHPLQLARFFFQTRPPAPLILCT